MRIGYFLSCEEYTPAQLVEQAVAAEEAGFEALWISDHFHPWNDEQGQSPFVWGVIGALSQVCDAAGHHRRHLPDGAHAPGDRRPGGRDRRRAARGPVHPRRRLRRGAQRARRSVTRGRRPTSGWRCSRRRSSSCASSGRASVRDPARAPLHGRQRTHLHPARAAAAGLRVRLRAEGDVAGRRDRRRLHLHQARRRPARAVQGAESGGKPAHGRLQGGLRRRPRTRASTSRTGSGRTPGFPASSRRCCRHPRTSSRRPSWSPGR